jgi:transcriptional regulator of PTS gene
MSDNPRESRNHSDLGRNNRRLVLSEVVLKGPLPRREIAQNTGLTMAAVSRISRDLIDAGLVFERPDTGDRGATRGPGRKLIDLDLDASAGYVLGVGVNVFSQVVTLADLKNRCVAHKELKLATLSDPDAMIERIVGEAEALIAATVPDRRRLLGASVALTGAVDPETGIVRNSHYLRWGEVALGPRLEDALNLDVRIESMPMALTLAESRFGIARGIRDLLTIICSVGTGAGMLMDGRIVRGQDFTAGMIGGVSLPGHDGATLDMLAGGVGVLQRLFPHLDIPATPANDLAEMLTATMNAAAAGDARSIEAVTEAGASLGRALVPFVAMLRPQAVMLTGPLAMSPIYTDACRSGLSEAAPALETRILASTMSHADAARWTAIGEFLLERDVDLESLRLAKAA